MVAFPRKAHGKPPASGCVTAAKMPDSRAFSNSSGQFHSIHTPVSGIPPPRAKLPTLVQTPAGYWKVLAAGPKVAGSARIAGDRTAKEQVLAQATGGLETIPEIPQLWEPNPDMPLGVSFTQCRNLTAAASVPGHQQNDLS